MGKIAAEDIELSCDEEVVRDMTRSEKINYSKTLVEAISKSQTRIYTTNFSGGVKMVKKRLDNILDRVNKKSSKALILILIFSIIGSSFLIGCESNGGKAESLLDKLYGYRTEKLGNYIKVSNLISSLDFQKEYNVRSALGGSYGNSMNLIFEEDEEIEFDEQKFGLQNAILFSLIDDLDSIEYSRIKKSERQEEGEEVEIEIKQSSIPVLRKNADSITVSILGMKTEEIGRSKKKFKDLLDFYEDFKEENNLINIVKLENEANLQATNFDKVNTIEGLKMKVKKPTINKTNLTLLLENDSAREIIYSTNGFVLEGQIDGQWYEMPNTQDVKDRFEDYAYILPIGGEQEIVIEWGWLYGEVGPGKYRIVKNIPDFSQENASDYLGAEFQID